MKKIKILSILMALLLLCGCQSAPAETTEPKAAAFTGDFDAYEMRYTGKWEKAWEEDILFFAEKYLTEHSRVSDSNFFTEYALDLSGEGEVVFDNSAFDPELRAEFVAAVDALLASIPERTDESIVSELRRIVVMLGDIHSGVYPADWDYGDFLPVCYEPFYHEDGVDFRVSIVTKVKKELLSARLVGYNGIPVDEVVERVCAYIPHESEEALGFMLTEAYGYSGLNEKEILIAAGIVDAKDLSLVAEFETENGVESHRISFISRNHSISYEYHPMLTDENLRYRYADGYWWIMLDDKTVYAQLTTMVDDYTSGYSIDNLFSEVRTAMRDSEVPLKVILDFRGNGGGYVHESALKGFVSATEWYEHDGVYILIDGNCFSAGVLAPYYLRQAIEGAQLVGAPTGQGLWFPANSAWYEMPNSGVGFRIGDEIVCAQLDWDDDALRPDVAVYQSLEDFEAGVDTVLQWALDD